jgi:hypothetical protein
VAEEQGVGFTNTERTTMTKTQRCDLLLCAAKHWQNHESVDYCCCYSEDVLGISRGAVFSWLDCGELVFGWAASMALSEAAGLGFDLETVKS